MPYVVVKYNWPSMLLKKSARVNDCVIVHLVNFGAPDGQDRQWRSKGGRGDICPRAQGYGERILEARTFFASQLIQKENMSHLQFWEFRCSVQCLL